MKLKQFLAAALMFCSAGAWAQTDVTSQYITNADFSSTEGWTQDHSSQYWSLGNGLIGTYAVANDKKSTADETHLNTEYCLGIQCRWQTNYAAFQQTKENATLTKGTYTVTFDVQNTNTATATGANYENLFYVQVGETKYTDSATEWQNSHPAWTTHTITFSVSEETTANITFSFGYKLNTNNGSTATPHVYVSHLKMTYTDPDAAAHSAVLNAAKFTLNGYIKKATALNGVLADETLTAAISTAQGVYDAADDWADDYENTVNASTTLNSAITTALSSATPVSLINANFDTDVNIAADGTSNASIISPATQEKPYIYGVSGWTQDFLFSNTAAQGTTAAYGATITGNKGNNSTNPPAVDMFNGDTGGALHLSSGWSDRARYKQVIENLPSGRYVFYYEANNQNNSANTINSNLFGVSGEAGDFYGTTNSFVYGETKTYAYNEWTACAFEFDVAKTANINFNVGLIGTTGGSASGAKLWIDNVQVYRIADLIVTDEEANAIIASAEALNDDKFNANDKNDLATKLATFKNSKTIDNYNMLNASLIQANSSIEVYANLNSAITKVEAWTATTAPEGLRSKYNNGEYANNVTPAEIYEEYQAAEIAALAAASATDYTSAIINPSFETGDMTGWSAESRNDTKVWPNSNGTYTTSGVDGSYLFNSWGGTAENNVYQTIKNLPAGTYTLSALLAGFNGESLVLAANANTNSVTVAGDKTTGYSVNVVFTLADAADVVIKASNTKSQEGSDASFIKADNFRLTAGDITTDDYTDLIAAINAAEAKAIGFDEGEYAPYNNVAALAALKAAKAVDQSVPMSQTDLDAIVNALTSATWTVNAAEVNAFYDGNFAIQSEHTTGPTALTGWNNPEGIRQLIKNTTTYPGLTSTTGQAAVFAWGNTNMTYGDAEGYTLPLKAHTIYEFSFKTCGWQDGDMGYVNVDIKNASNEGLQTVATATATKRITESEPWDEFKVIFETGEAGNYKFGMWTSKHTTFTDLVLKKAVAENLVLSENEDYTPVETYANVTMSRTIKAAYNTVVLPFALTADQVTAAFGENSKVYTFSENSANANSVELTFTEGDGSISANVPVLVKATTASTEQTFNGVMIEAPASAVQVEGKYVDYVGVYATTNLAAGDFFLATQNEEQKIFQSEGNNDTVKGFRAYFKTKTAGVKAALFIDGVATAIEGINADVNNDAEIFNLAGQRVNKAQRGIYIINGKKVLVK